MAYTKEDLTNVVIGSALLGSGGGGSFTDSLSILNDVPSDYQVDVASIDDIDKNDTFCHSLSWLPKRRREPDFK